MRAWAAQSVFWPCRLHLLPPSFPHLLLLPTNSPFPTPPTPTPPRWTLQPSPALCAEQCGWTCGWWTWRVWRWSPCWPWSSSSSRFWSILVGWQTTTAVSEETRATFPPPVADYVLLKFQPPEEGAVCGSSDWSGVFVLVSVLAPAIKVPLKNFGLYLLFLLAIFCTDFFNDYPCPPILQLLHFKTRNLRSWNYHLIGKSYCNGKIITLDEKIMRNVTTSSYWSHFVETHLACHSALMQFDYIIGRSIVTI